MFASRYELVTLSTSSSTRTARGEVSPSGTGVKIICRARLPQGCKHVMKLTDVISFGDKAPEIAIYDHSRLGEIMAQESIEIAILAVPTDAAQQMCDRIVEVGIRAILNVVVLPAPFGPSNPTISPSWRLILT